MNGGWTIQKLREQSWGEPSECWMWKGAPDGKGYGAAYVDGRSVGVHRLAYAVANQVDLAAMDSTELVRHDCDEPMCVNPAHLRTGDAWDNYHDSRKRGRRPMRATHCCHGHEYVPKNTYVDPRGRRHCRECDRLRSLKSSPALKRGRYKTKNNPDGAEIPGTTPLPS